ncbi:hypothetical protein FKM82_023885 [Ascaphus truei]
MTLLRTDWVFSTDSAMRNRLCCHLKIPEPQPACGRSREPPLKTSSLRMTALSEERPRGSPLYGRSLSLETKLHALYRFCTSYTLPKSSLYCCHLI